MKKLYALQAVGVAMLLGLCWWKNKISYRRQSKTWRLVKTSVDCGLIVSCALYLSSMLVAWAVLLLTRGIRSNGIRVTASVIFGIAFGAISGIALEILCALSILSVDLVTGEQGIWGKWQTGPPNTFLPWLNKDQYVP